MSGIKQGETRKCFVCLAKVNHDFNSINSFNNDKNNWLCKRFCALICRYLQINSRDPSTSKYCDIKKTLSLIHEKNEYQNRDFNICVNCQPELETFCRNYEEFYKLQLKLNWSVGRIKKLMNGKRKNGASPGKGFMGPSREREIENFRATICNHAKAKCKRIPQVAIKKLDKAEIAKIRTKLAANSSYKSHVSHHVQPDPVPGPSSMEVGFSDDEDDFGGGAFDHDPLASDNDDDEPPQPQNATIHENSIGGKAKATSSILNLNSTKPRPEPPKENGISINIGNSNVISCKVCKKIFHHGVSLRIHLRLVHKLTDLDQIDSQSQNGPDEGHHRENQEAETNSNVARPSSRASSRSMSSFGQADDNDFGAASVSERESDPEENEAEPEPTPKQKLKPLLKCRFCPNEFKTPQSRFLHEKSHKTDNVKESKPEPENKSKPEKNKCKFCDQKFRTPQSRFLHERSHKTEKSKNVKESMPDSAQPENKSKSEKNKCRICNKEFRTPQSRFLHERSHKTDKSKSVRESKPEPEPAQPEKKLIHGKNKCRFCDQEFHTPQSRFLHERVHKGKEQTPRRQEREEEEVQVEKPEIQTTSFNASGPANSNLIDCDICGKTFHHRGSWRIHQRLVHKMTDVALNQDFKTATTTTENGISSESRNHEPEQEQEDLCYQCQFCDRKFRFPQTKFLHERSHKNQKRVENKNDIEPTNKVVGTVGVGGSGRFTCQICNTKFRNGRILSKHISTAHGGASGSPAATSASLTKSKFNNKTKKRKKSTHSTGTSKGKGKFNCQFCGRSFNYKQNCNVHERTHTGEKPFKCGICGERFMYTDNCKRHLKMVHNVNSGHIISDLKRGNTRRSTIDENGDKPEVKGKPVLQEGVGKVKRRPGRPPKKIQQETENSAGDGDDGENVDSLEEPPRVRIVVKTESDALPDPVPDAEPVPELEMEQGQSEHEQNNDDHDGAMDSISDPLTTNNPLSETEDVTVNTANTNANGHEYGGVAELATASSYVNPNVVTDTDTDAANNLNFNLELLEQDRENPDHSKINQ